MSAFGTSCNWRERLSKFQKLIGIASTHVGQNTVEELKSWAARHGLVLGTIIENWPSKAELDLLLVQQEAVRKKTARRPSPTSNSLTVPYHPSSTSSLLTAPHVLG